MEGGREDGPGNVREMNGGETGGLRGEEEGNLSRKRQRETGDGGGEMVEGIGARGGEAALAVAAPTQGQQWRLKGGSGGNWNNSGRVSETEARGGGGVSGGRGRGT